MKTIFHSQGQTLTGIIIVLVIVGLITGGLYFYFSKQIPEIPEIAEKPAEEEVVKLEEVVTPLPEKEVVPEKEIIPEKIVPVPEEKIEDKPVEKPIVQKCADGTLYGQCSINKPKYCDHGTLIDKCSMCGCPPNQYCDEMSDLCKTKEKLDMLIFISPQYRNDIQIKQAINEYINAVEKDIGWKTKIITLTPDINDFRKIDEIIEEHYSKSGGELKACIMVGEDINTALRAETSNREIPSVLPWATLESYAMVRQNESIGHCIEGLCKVFDISTGKIIEKFNEQEGRVLKYGVTGPARTLNALRRLDILISLIYPTHELPYEIRAQQIRSVFEKFSKNRNKVYPKRSAIFLDKVRGGRGEEKDYQFLKEHNFKTDFLINLTPKEVQDRLDDKYALFSVHGHGTPSGISVSTYPPEITIFHSSYLNKLNTPLFLAGGCNVAGWWTNDFENNDKLDFSINIEWFGSKIFVNPHLRVIVSQFPAQVDVNLRSFTEVILPGLMRGKTLAESSIGKTLRIDNMIIYGDPTFYYNF